MENEKLGHQAPKRYRINRFNSVEIKGDFAYCKSHNFVYDCEKEEEKLYNAEPCHYTDSRYVDSHGNFYKNCHLKTSRFIDFSLKAAIRNVLSCRNIPIGTIVDFKKSWYYTKKRIDNSYKFKVKKEVRFNPNYEINLKGYSKDFTNCKRSQDLTNALRNAGFLVFVKQNESFLGGMLNVAASYTGGKLNDIETDGEIAIAYGFGRKIGFSSFENDYMGYSNGCENILYDFFGEFNKWSQCIEINKTTPIDEIIKILTDDKEREV